MNNIYDINNIHDNDVRNISELNLQHYLYHPSKLVKTTDSYYSLIIHGCINTVWMIEMPHFHHHT